MSYTGDFRSHLRDPDYPWRQVTPEILARLRPPPEDTDTFVDDEGACRILGIDTSTLHTTRERLCIPRVARGRYRVWELYVWARLNDPLAGVR